MDLNMKPNWREEITERYPGLLLRPNWRDPQGPRVPVYLGVGDGWAPIIIKLVEDIHQIWLTLDPEEQHQTYVVQVKEKFGGLRFYMGRSNDTIRALIQAAETSAEGVCEYCGAPGEVRSGSWLKTRCDACEVQHQEKRKEEIAAYEARYKQQQEAKLSDRD